MSVPFTCPECEAEESSSEATRPLVQWSHPQAGSYGWACLEHRLFLTRTTIVSAGPDAPYDLVGDLVAVPLAEVPLPPGYERVPAYRRAAGWEETVQVHVGEERLREILREELDRPRQLEIP